MKIQVKFYNIKSLFKSNSTLSFESKRYKRRRDTFSPLFNHLFKPILFNRGGEKGIFRLHHTYSRASTVLMLLEGTTSSMGKGFSRYPFWSRGSFNQEVLYAEDGGEEGVWQQSRQDRLANSFSVAVCTEREDADVFRVKRIVGKRGLNRVIHRWGWKKEMKEEEGRGPAVIFHDRYCEPRISDGNHFRAADCTPNHHLR